MKLLFLLIRFFNFRKYWFKKPVINIYEVDSNLLKVENSLILLKWEVRHAFFIRIKGAKGIFLEEEGYLQVAITNQESLIIKVYCPYSIRPVLFTFPLNGKSLQFKNHQLVLEKAAIPEIAPAFYQHKGRINIPGLTMKRIKQKEVKLKSLKAFSKERQLEIQSRTSLNKKLSSIKQVDLLAPETKATLFEASVNNGIFNIKNAETAIQKHLK